MKKDDLLDHLIQHYPNLISIKENIYNAYIHLETCYLNGCKLLIAGNGGSSSDADHIVGELMKGFVLKRKINSSLEKELINIDEEKGKILSDALQQGLPAISLANHSALNTAFANDVNGNLCFAQQVLGYGEPGDILLCISTSGNAENLQYAAIVAKAKGMNVIGLTGNNGGELDAYCDVNIIVPENETYIIQELHLPIYHCLCLMLEDKFFSQ